MNIYVSRDRPNAKNQMPRTNWNLGLGSWNLALGSYFDANDLTKKEFTVLTSYPVACPHENCGWNGSLVPSLLRGGADAEIAEMHLAWFQCPRCQCDWEVRISDDRVTVLPVPAPVD